MENQWASKLFCSVVYFSFTNYKSKNKKMISDHFFLRTLKQSTILSTPGSLTLQVDSLPTEPPGKPSGKESSCQCRGHGFDPQVGKILWRRKWQPTLVLLPGEFHGQRSLTSPWSHKRVGHDLATKQQRGHTTNESALNSIREIFLSTCILFCLE